MTHVLAVSTGPGSAGWASTSGSSVAVTAPPETHPCRQCLRSRARLSETPTEPLSALFGHKASPPTTLRIANVTSASREELSWRDQQHSTSGYTSQMLTQSPSYRGYRRYKAESANPVRQPVNTVGSPCLTPLAACW